MSSHLTFLILQMRIIVHGPTECFPHFSVDNKVTLTFLWKSSKSILKVSSYFLEAGETDLNSLQPFSFHPFRSSLLLCSFGYGKCSEKSHDHDLCLMGTGDSSSRAHRTFWVVGHGRNLN